MDEKHKKIIQECREVLKEFLDPMRMMESFPQIFVAGSENFNKVYRKFGRPHEAVNVIIEVILTSDVDLFQQFTGAIRQCEHLWLAELLSSGDNELVAMAMLKMENIEYVRKFLTLLMPEMRKTMVTNDVADKLKEADIITDEEYDRIESRVREDGNAAGFRLLITLLVRKEPGWWNDLVRISGELGYREDLVSSLKAITEGIKDKLSIRTSDDCAKSEEGAFGECSAVGKNTAKFQERGRKTESSKQPTELLDISSKKQENSVRTLRNYQLDLAKKAARGENVIINAPTGSGKTIVAAYIIKERFEDKLKRDPKIAFLVPRVALSKQQHDQIKLFLASDEWSIDYLVGDSKTTLKDVMQTSNIIVMTPQILVNALEDEEIYSITQFDMLVLDECHHTNKGDPYNMIMLEYLKVKHDSNKSSRLPQVIGLTATIGVGKGKKDSDAINHMMSLCANLDAVGGIVTVSPENMDELYYYTETAEEYNFEFEKCMDDPFSVVIRNTIDDIVKELYKLKFQAKLKYLSRPHSMQKGSNQYVQWCQTLPTTAALSLSSRADKDLCMDIQTCGFYLMIFNQALDLHFKCRAIDALKFLEGKIRDAYDRDLTRMENLMRDMARKSIVQLRKCQADPACVNENLVKMEQEILKTFQQDSNSRVMLNVPVRQYTEPLRDWLNDSKDLQVLNLNAEVFTGVGKSQDGSVSGLTHNKQENILQMFRTGDTKILVCTPEVASEGMDIVDCNLVISYDCIQNEISKTQVKGRARKAGGRMVEFSSREVVARNKINTSKTLLMDETTRKIQLMYEEDRDKYLKDLDKRQTTEITLAKLKEKQSSSKNKKPNGSQKFKVHCKKCQSFVCNSSDIVVMNETMYTCNSDQFKKSFNAKVVEHKGTEEKKGLFCKGCNAAWGIFTKYKQISIPLLKPNAFVFVDEMDEKNRIAGSKWNDIKIEFQRVQYEDMARSLLN